MTKLTLETAKLMFKSTDEAIRQFALDNFPELGKKPLPKTWKELEIIYWYYVDKLSDIRSCEDAKTNGSNRIFRKTEEQAKASIAMSQLSQLMYVYNDGWEPDRTVDSIKYWIFFRAWIITFEKFYFNHVFLVFKTEEICKEFLHNFRELIEEAKALL